MAIKPVDFLISSNTPCERGGQVSGDSTGSAVRDRDRVSGGGSGENAKNLPLLPGHRIDGESPREGGDGTSTVTVLTRH